MTISLRRVALSLVTFSLIVAAPVTSPVIAAPVVVDTIAVGLGPWAVAFSPNGKQAYVAMVNIATVSVIR